MSKVLDLLAQAGYDLSAGNNTFPMVISKEDRPIGFLMENGTSELIANHREDQQIIQDIVHFAAEHQELEEINGEYKLGQYQDTVFMASFDFENMQPVYSVYTMHNGELKLEHKSFDKDEATTLFSQSAGLIKDGAILNAEQKNFQDLLTRLNEHNFSVEPTKEAGRTHVIYNKANEVVGYIGKNQQVEIISRNNRTQSLLTNIHEDRMPKPLTISFNLPPVIQILKAKLQDINLSLRSMFTRKGMKHYINDRNTTVGIIDEKDTLQFEQTAIQERVEQIGKIVEEIKQENREKLQQQDTTHEKSTETQDIASNTQETQQAIEAETQDIDPNTQETQQAIEAETQDIDPNTQELFNEAETQTLMTFLAVELTKNREVMANPQIAPILTKLKEQAVKDGLIKPDHAISGNQKDLGAKLKEAGEKSKQVQQNRESRAQMPSKTPIQEVS